MCTLGTMLEILSVGNMEFTTSTINRWSRRRNVQYASQSVSPTLSMLQLQDRIGRIQLQSRSNQKSASTPALGSPGWSQVRIRSESRESVARYKHDFLETLLIHRVQRSLSFSSTLHNHWVGDPRISQEKCSFFPHCLIGKRGPGRAE